MYHKHDKKAATPSRAVLCPTNPPLSPFEKGGGEKDIFEKGGKRISLKKER